MAEKRLSPMQMQFLSFAVHEPIYIGSLLRFNPKLPARGAVATTVASSLIRRGYINETGFITEAGKEALQQEAAHA